MPEPARPTKEAFRAELERLVANFAANEDEFTSPGYTEMEARTQFITPFFRALGWDVENRAAKPRREREVWEEKGPGEGRPDYTFRIGGLSKFFVEAKAPHQNLGDRHHILQVKSYAWSTNEVFAVVLTDFEEFRFYDASLAPDEKDYNRGLIFDFRYNQYLRHIDDLWKLSRESVAAGSIEARLPQDKLSVRFRKPVDDHFLESMTRWRLELAKAVHKRNPSLDDRTLTEIVQRLLDRLIFIRVAEDRRILEKNALLDRALEWEAIGGRKPLLPMLNELFHQINDDFNGEIFKYHQCEEIRLDDPALYRLIKDLYPPKSHYAFNYIPVDIFGAVYERYLGKTLKVRGKEVKDEEKPEVRKAGGVYYTPKFIVDYIVKHTVGNVIEGKTPKEIEKVRILDPACGSGSFLIGAFQYLIDHHVAYYEKHPKEARVHPLYPELVQDGDGTPHLSIHRKAKILRNNLYGVDLDPQAVEITMMNLYLKALEDERELPHKQQLLPELKFNIRCGNSLIGPDIAQEQELSPEELVRLNPFDWHSQTDGLGDIVGAAEGPERESRGFDAVIGNPPWGAGFHDPEKGYLDTHFTLGAGKYESYIYFLERGTGLVKPGGYFGFIVPSYWISRSQTETLREYLTTASTPTSCIVLPENVFAGVKMDSCLLTVVRGSPRGDESITVAEIPPNQLPAFASGQSANLFESVCIRDWRTNKHFRFNPRISAADVSLIEKIEKNIVKLETIVEITQGLTLYRKTTLIEQFGKKKAEEILHKRLFHANRKKNKTFKKELVGKDVDRYFAQWGGKAWVSYGPWLAHAVDERFFRGPRLVVQKIRNPLLRRRLVVGYLDDDETYSAGVLLNAIPRSNSPYSLLYCLALLNSRLINYWYRKMILDVSVRVVDLKEVPIRKIECSKPVEKAVHDKLTTLAQRMLDLVAKLNKVKQPAERNSFGHQVDTTDRDIDQAVYDLYGLTAAERRLVEQSFSEKR